MMCLFLACAAVQQRVAIKECKFFLTSVKPYNFTFSSVKVDFDIKVDNPNSIDALLDKFVYRFYVNDMDVFSGTTGNAISIPAKQSKQFTTTITLDYNKIGQALVEAMQLKTAAYRIEARAYINTILGPVSYPVQIELD
jgi:LEA14-like dessication related protein